jgi:TPP-dependent pyruvate/acetoin dehydrogenase alpha subunit
MITKEDMIAFEDIIADEFNAGKIPFPVHLSSGNEDALIEIFENVGPDDWIFGSWRMHYHALLRGVSQQDLRAAICRGESMALSFPSKRVYGSAIVGGIIPIALGTAMSIAREGRDETVWCFIGDMTFETGTFHECHKYGVNHDLPIKFVIEDNGVSVCTDTRTVWGGPAQLGLDQVDRYKYKSKWPHAGAGQRVQF